MKVQFLLLITVLVVSQSFGAAYGPGVNVTMVRKEYGNYREYLKNTPNDAQALTELRNNLDRYVAQADVQPVLQHDILLKRGFVKLRDLINCQIISAAQPNRHLGVQRRLFQD